MKRAVISILLAACANAPPLEPGAGVGEAATEGAPCDAATLCGAGQACLAGTCLSLCRSDAECGARRCVLFPNSDSGYCDAAPSAGGSPPVGGGAQPAPGGAEVAPPPPSEEGLPPKPPGPAGDEPAPPPPPGEEDPTPPPAGGGEAPPPSVDGDDTPPPAGDEPEPPEVEPTPPDDEPAPPDEVPPPDCEYPAAGRDITYGSAVPRFRWATALDADRNPVDFDLERFHCDPAWARYNVAAFVVGAGWCGACEEYDRQAGAISRDFAAAGGLFVLVTVEDASYVPADSETSYRIVAHTFGDGPGLRVGDADTQPEPMSIQSSSIVQSYPAAFVVRRSDMQVIADQNRDAFTLDFLQIARDEAGGGPGPDPGGDCVEEPGEPNDTAASAVRLSPGGEIAGGICNGRPDFYAIEVAGRWRVELEFRHADGDLDLYLWDTARGDVAVGADGRPLGSVSADDDEAYEGRGPATLQIVGYQGARAPYRIRLREL